MGQRFSFLIAVVWVAALVVGSLLPLKAKVFLRTTSAAHRPIHYAAFGATALLLVSIAKTPGQRAVALATVVGVAVSVETLQHVIYHSSFEFWDVRDDTVAAVLGWAIEGAWRRIRVVMRQVPQT